MYELAHFCNRERSEVNGEMQVSSKKKKENEKALKICQRS